MASQPPSRLHHFTSRGQSYCNQGPGQFASPPAAPAETAAHARAPAQSFAALTGWLPALPTNLFLPAEQPSHIAYQASHADQLLPAEQPSPTDQPLPADQPARAVQTPFPIGQRSLGESGGEGCPDRSDGRSSNQRSSPGNAGTGGHRGGDGNSRSEGAQTFGSAQEPMEPPIRVGGPALTCSSQQDCCEGLGTAARFLSAAAIIQEQFAGRATSHSAYGSQFCTHNLFVVAATAVSCGSFEMDPRCWLLLLMSIVHSCLAGLRRVNVVRRSSAAAGLPSLNGKFIWS